MLIKRVPISLKFILLTHININALSLGILVGAFKKLMDYF